MKSFFSSGAFASARDRIAPARQEPERTKDLRREECDDAEEKERDEPAARVVPSTCEKHRDILDGARPDQEIEGASGPSRNKAQATRDEQLGFFDRRESLQIRRLLELRTRELERTKDLSEEQATPPRRRSATRKTPRWLSSKTGISSSRSRNRRRGHGGRQEQRKAYEGEQRGFDRHVVGRYNQVIAEWRRRTPI